MQVAPSFFPLSPIEAEALVRMLTDRWRSGQADFNQSGKQLGLRLRVDIGSLSDLPQHPDMDSWHSVLP